MNFPAAKGFYYSFSNDPTNNCPFFEFQILCWSRRIGISVPCQCYNDFITIDDFIAFPICNLAKKLINSILCKKLHFLAAKKMHFNFYYAFFQ